jgi:hypothetical protein
MFKVMGELHLTLPEVVILNADNMRELSLSGVVGFVYAASY